MQIGTSRQGGFLVVAPEGRLDTVAGRDFELRCADLIREGDERVIFNMAALDYIGSAGLRAILLASRKVASLKGKLALCGLTPCTREVFTIAGLDRSFTIYDNLDEAVRLEGAGS